MLSQVEATLKVAGNIELYDPNTIRTKYEDIVNNQIIVFDGKVFVVETARKLWIDVLTYALNKYGIESLSLHRVPDGVPTSASYIGTKDNLSPHGNLLSKRLDEFNCVVYVNYSKQSILRKIQELGSLLEVNVDLSKIV